MCGKYFTKFKESRYEVYESQESFIELFFHDFIFLYDNIF
jgi:hypothetical protein